MNYEIREEGSFKYIESNTGQETLLLLHGLFGALSNFQGIIDHFGQNGKYNVVVPMLPIYELPVEEVSLSGLVQHVQNFVDFKGYEKVHVLGNSLGGHIALLYALAVPGKTQTMTLTGSSGLFESGMGNTFPKRGNYEFVETKTRATFYDPNVATKELIDEVYDIVNDRNKVLRVIKTAKSALRHNLSDKLDDIKAPTLLIWGKQDTITPPFVGEKFDELLPNSTLVFVDKCGHAPMMEHPDLFNQHLADFLAKQ
ncbi:MAG: alpha/beta hydrolase [Bacteroidota bacterium]